MAMSGLFTAVSGLRSGQAGLYVTGHNMANHSVPGFTRQMPHQAHFLHRTVGTNANGAMQIGLGTNPTGIRQVRNVWYDMRFRETAPRLTYWDTRANTHAELDAIFGELEGHYRLHLSLSQLNTALNELNNDPSSRDTRANFLSQAGTFIDRANAAQRSLIQYQIQLNNDVVSTVQRINQIITDIDDLNKRIVVEKTNGLNPNDFLDWRNNLLDELSGLICVTINEEPRGSVSILVTQGGHELLSAGGHIARMGLRQSAPLSPFVEPVFTTEDRILEFGEHAIPVFNWERLAANYAEVNGGERGLLLSLLSSRGLGPANYASPSPAETRQDILTRITPPASFIGLLTEFDDIALDWNTFRTGANFPMAPPAVPAMVDLQTFLQTPPHLRGAVPSTPAGIVDDVPLVRAAIATELGLGNITQEEADGMNAFLDNLVPSSTAHPVMRIVHDFDLVGRRTFDMNVAVIPQVLAQFDTLVNHIVDMFNTALTTDSLGLGSPPQNQHGISHGQGTPPANLALFVQIRPGDGYTLGNLRINPLFLGDGAASHMPLTWDGESDNRLTLHLMREWNQPNISFGEWSQMGINQFYRNFITQMATGGNEARNYVRSTTEEIEFVDHRRKSISAVSLEEEMSNMIRFQHAYNSSARMITAMDSMLDHIINRIGAGRG